MTIISSKPDQVAKAIDEQVGRYLTILDGRGYYSREEKDVLYVVVAKHKCLELRKLYVRLIIKPFSCA